MVLESDNEEKMKEDMINHMILSHTIGHWFYFITQTGIADTDAVDQHEEIRKKMEGIATLGGKFDDKMDRKDRMWYWFTNVTDEEHPQEVMNYVLEEFNKTQGTSSKPKRKDSESEKRDQDSSDEEMEVDPQEKEGSVEAEEDSERLEIEVDEHDEDNGGNSPKSPSVFETEVRPSKEHEEVVKAVQEGKLHKTFGEIKQMVTVKKKRPKRVGEIIQPTTSQRK